MKKRLPKLKSNKAAEHFLEEDISDYINSNNFSLASFEYAPKNKTVSLRLSDALLAAIKNVSKKHRIPYQRYIREVLERSVKKDAA